MLRRKRLVLLAGLVLVGTAAFSLWPRPDRITKANFDRIKEGMSQADVEAILGPAGDYSTGRRLFIFESAGLSRDQISESEVDAAQSGLCWEGDTGRIDVAIGPNGVSSAIYSSAHKIKQDPLSYLIWRAKRQWRRWYQE
jgi:hypothetical protein